jgi:spore coat polysaccharide biosynthesis protein SpsF (cytidylyltransferase family)/2-polyprenyl-3-methyl-5-hydroxy-6-metoxy-1,4-benzoquinol methylase
MTAIILQARLDSTRLPRKALLDLGGKPVIVRVMENLRRVEADAWILACDTASEETLAPLAKDAGFTCIAGPKEDVLERFCLVIRKTGASTILRATGDNPYLFADAAAKSLERFAALQDSADRADYFTFTGLPHGSGIEVFSARRLLEAAALTDSPWDHEHVGPALYNHPDRFVAVRECAPAQWNHPEVRTTIDTREDYERACEIERVLSRKKKKLPSSSEDILEAWRYIAHPVLFVPACAPGQGTGHLQRIASLAEALSPERRCIVYVPQDSQACTERFRNPAVPVVQELPSSASLVVIDGFRTSVRDMKLYRAIGPIVALDEGGSGRSLADYLLDIIPGRRKIAVVPNKFDVSFLPLPTNRRRSVPKKIRSALVLAGGENAAGLAIPAGQSLISMGFDVTVIDPKARGLEKMDGGLTVSGPIENLRENLCHYDLVLTHFGFTAFEALAAGCYVMLFSPTLYHYLLGRDSGFSVLPPGSLDAKRIRAILRTGVNIPKVITPGTGKSELSAEIRNLSSGERSSCPLCGCDIPYSIFARHPDRSVALCPSCRMRYLRFRVAGPKSYARSYFFDEYRAQYGKTYLEDFESIKAQGTRRMNIIAGVFASRFHDGSCPEKNVLDVGCAYGPFLAAARDNGWNPFGTDISDDAVAYVRDELSIPAWVAQFPAPDSTGEIDRRRYASLTMWFVIEHFRNLVPVLERANRLLVPGGIFAFSTPSAAGVSARFSPESFYRQSPSDHYTIWDPRTVRDQLARYGFSVVKIVSTGHHPERFPGMKNAKPGGFRAKIFGFLSRLFALGDTFEVYAVKSRTLEDKK